MSVEFPRDILPHGGEGRILDLRASSENLIIFD
jgi:hypothetical protein